MRRLATWLLIGFALPAQAYTETDRSISIDGDSSDFQPEELFFNPGEELAFDSRWGENNDINQIRATWNTDSLFVAVDGRCWGNNVMLFFDTTPSSGIPDMDLVTTGWRRKLRFLNQAPDLFLATWDTNTEPQMWRVQTGDQTSAEQLVVNSQFIASASFNQGRPFASMEAAIPWSEVFPGYDGLIPAGREIGLVAVVVSGADGQSGPDCAPDNSSFFDLPGMPENSGEIAFLDNFIILRPDRDEDGLADMGVAPSWRSGDIISETPPMSFFFNPGNSKIGTTEPEALVKAISPNGDGLHDLAHFRMSISHNLTTESILELIHDRIFGDVFDGTGRRIHFLTREFVVLSESDVQIDFYWDGRNEQRHSQEPGLYYARVEIEGVDRFLMPMAVLR